MSKHTFTQSRKRRIKLAMAQGIPCRVAKHQMLLERLVNQSCEEHRAKLNRERKAGVAYG